MTNRQIILIGLALGVLFSAVAEVDKVTSKAVVDLQRQIAEGRSK